MAGSGAARGIRTPDPIITNDVLYQLSYCGIPGTLPTREPVGGNHNGTREPTPARNGL